MDQKLQDIIDLIDDARESQTRPDYPNGNMDDQVRSMIFDAQRLIPMAISVRYLGKNVKAVLVSDIEALCWQLLELLSSNTPWKDTEADRLSKSLFQLVGTVPQPQQLEEASRRLNCVVLSRQADELETLLQERWIPDRVCGWCVARIEQLKAQIALLSQPKSLFTGVT